MSQPLRTASTYLDAGVYTDAAEEQLCIAKELFRKTWKEDVQLDFSSFANVIDVGNGLGVAYCTDGVGSKALIAQLVGKYDTIGIDCVAMNVNDLICVGARPRTFLDYIAVEDIRTGVIPDIAQGLFRAATEAGVSVTGGETSQLPDMIKGASRGTGFDLVGTAIGTVHLGNLVNGAGLENGDVIIGIESSGIHCNGLSLARKVFLKDAGLNVQSALPNFNLTLAEELLRPTYIYVNEVLDALNNWVAKAAIHITSDGFNNLTRTASDVNFVLDNLPEVPAIFRSIQEIGRIDFAEMYSVYNMGIGFCLISSPRLADKVLSTIRERGKNAWTIGYVTTNPVGKVRIVRNDFLGHDLVGDGKHFRPLTV